MCEFTKRRMSRTHILTFSIVCLIVAVGCVIAAVIVVQKNDIVKDVDNQEECEANMPTNPPGCAGEPAWAFPWCSGPTVIFGPLDCLGIAGREKKGKS